MTGKGCLFPDPQVLRLYARYPNAIPLDNHQKSASEEYSRGENVLICNECEMELVARIKPGER